MIASDLPVFHESFNEEAIQYAKAGDQEAWAKALLHILARPSEAIERARKARAVVCEQFTLDRMVEGYVSLYEQQLARQKRSL